jgi:hypothetical protein
MTVKMILPDSNSACTHLRRRVALNSGTRSEEMRSGMVKAIRTANRSGIIQFTLTA